MVDFGQQQPFQTQQPPQPPGMMGAAPPIGGISGGYSYNTALPAFRVSNPVAGLSSMANALINGYFDHKVQQQNQFAPVQLPGATAPPNVLSTIFGGDQSAAQAPTMADPSTAGGLY